MRIGPARDIAGRVHARRAGLQISIDENPAVDFQSGLLGERQARPHTDADDNQICLERGTAFQRRRRPSIAVDRLAQMEDDAVLFVQARE